MRRRGGSGALRLLRRAVRFGVASVGLVFSATGCLSASLATNTGPTLPGQAWCMDGAQRAHVGEAVAFDFVLTDGGGAFVSPTGVVDYVVATLGSEREEVEADPGGHFVFSHTFKTLKPGDRVRVTAEAFRERGRRDFVRVLGRWVGPEISHDQPDQRIAGDVVDLEFYQTVVDLPVDGTGDEMDRETGVMRFRRLDGRAFAVYADRPGRPGFEFREGSTAGSFRVTFQPDAAMLNPNGTTDVEFSIQDRAGRRVTASARAPTP